MILTPVRRAILAGAASSLVLIVLSGCFLLPTTITGGGESTASPTWTPHDAAEPEVGDCWSASYAELAEWASWLGDDPVACDRRHQAMTFFVGTLDGPYEDAWSNDSTRSEVTSAVVDACMPAFADLGFPEDQTRVNLFFFIADETAWSAGYQDFRCDVGVYAIDSDYYQLEVANLPDSIDELATDVAENPEFYDLCLIGDAFGPYESTELYVADCTVDYYWRFVQDVTYPSELSDPFPTGNELYAFADEKCGELEPRPGEEILYYVPTLQMWENNYRYVECWFSTLESPTSIV